MRLRNIVIMGEQGTGKTTLSEAILYQGKVIEKPGKVEEGTTISDYDPLERKRGMSINPSLLWLEYEGCRINIIDTPGFTDFVEKIYPVLRAVEGAVLVTSPSLGIGMDTKWLWEEARKEKIPCLVFYTRIDEEEPNLEKIAKEIEKELGGRCAFLNVPFRKGGSLGLYDILAQESFQYSEKGKEKKDTPPFVSEWVKKLTEIAAEAEDALIEKYLEEEKLEPKEIVAGLKKQFREGNLVLVGFGAGTVPAGVDSLLRWIKDIFPSPEEREEVRGTHPESGEEIKRKIDPGQPLSGFVFFALSEEHVGEMILFKIYSGTLPSGGSFYNVNKKVEEKVGQIYLLQGNKREEISEVSAGGIGMVTRLKATGIGDSLSTKENPILFPPLKFSQPTTSIALRVKDKKDEQRISSALSRISKVDPLLRVEVDPESTQTVLSGMGEIHLELVTQRLKEEFKVNIETEPPRIPYRETITKEATAQGKYKRQTGGRGQYGDVWLRIRPLPRGEGFKFVDQIRGGVVPAKYIPSVEKGVREALKKGVLASCPVVDVEVTLYDGSYHPVDSSDIAFHIAGSLGFKKAAQEAGPILLEPIMEVEVEIPEKFLGEVNGDLNSRRGKILGIEPVGEKQRVRAQVPLAELHNYSTRLRSITQGKGRFRKKFSHYEKVPEEIAQKIIAQAKEEKEGK